MRRDRFDLSLRATAVCRGIDGKGAQAFGTALARAREDDVEIRDSGIGYPRLLALEDVAAVFAPRARRQRADVRAGLKLRERERGDAPPRGDLGQISPLQLGAAE